MKTKHLRLMQRVYIILFFCFILLDSYSDAVHDTTNLRYLQCKFLDLFFR